jgi:hypothetical protein
VAGRARHPDAPVTVVTTYLEMRAPAALRAARAPRVAAELRTVDDPAVNRAC